jgi:hypothetical protein
MKTDSVIFSCVLISYPFAPGYLVSSHTSLFAFVSLLQKTQSPFTHPRMIDKYNKDGELDDTGSFAYAASNTVSERWE